MQFTSADIGGYVGTFLWPLIRVSAFIMSLPVYTARGVPMQTRMIFAVALTMACVAPLPAAPAIDPLSGTGLLVAVQQMLIGASLGFVLRLVFAAMVTAGHITALGMGLGFASMVDPTNGVQVPVISMFYSILATLLFLTLDGHLVAIEVLAESFRVLPVGPDGLAAPSLYDLVRWGSWIFSGGVLLALPATTAILMINLAFGVMTRAAPQLNIFAIGFPVIISAGFIVLVMTLGSTQDVFISLTQQALELMRNMLFAAGSKP
jgi:flagellar biosynthetic protein FliR